MVVTFNHYIQVILIHMDASVVVPDVTFTVNYSYHLEVGAIMGVHPV